ncbi:MAG: MASE3 domain-containing protein [Candidatus Latescibacterota bacterium]
MRLRAARSSCLSLLLAPLVLVALYLASRANYLLFHSLVEGFSIAVVIGAFMVVWNARRFLQSGYLMWVGCAYLFVGALDGLHLLAYKGMGVFPAQANLATQLWIAARWMESLSLLMASFFLARRPNLQALLGGYALAFALIVLAIFAIYRALVETALSRPYESLFRALAQSEERFRTTLASIGDGVITTDEHGHVIFLNAVAEALTGWSAAEAAGRPVGEVFRTVVEQTRQPAADVVQVSLSQGRVATMADHTALLARHGGSTPIADSAAPITDDEGRVRGVVAVFHDVTEARRARQMIEQSEARLRAFNDELERRVEERTEQARHLADQLRTLMAELTQAEQRERQRLASILHDHTQQLLVAASLHVGGARRAGTPQAREQSLGMVEDLIQQSIASCRSLAVELMPPVLRRAGLGAALGWLAQRLRDHHGLEATLEVEAGVGPLAEDVRLLLLESARELLLNVVKHAGVPQAHLALRRVDGCVQLVVTDEGRGFDPATTCHDKRTEGGFGLFSVEQRVRYLGGTVDAQSAPGQGTRVCLRVPLQGTGG